jgi:uncharacterized protein (TIGR04255 family)
VTRDEFFPDSPRVLYDKAPLKTVICQLRFPAVLKIESEVPSNFQQRIRHILPLTERNEGPAFPLPIPKNVNEVLVGAIGYTFLTEDRRTSIQLGSSALTYQTTVYKLWENLLETLMPAIRALKDIYEPAFYSRIGLRYVDSVDRAALGMQNTPWSELLNQVILGELAEHFFEANVEALQKSIRVRNSDKQGGFLLQHGMTRPEPDAPTVYVVDFDFYVDQRTETKDAPSVLIDLHDRSGRAWRWCITSKLHEVLGPRTI